jgi:hypothetical protein
MAIGVKEYNGSSWVRAVVRSLDGVWDTSSGKVKRFNGSSWVNINPSWGTWTTTWTANWSQTYENDNTQRTDATGLCYQGYYSSTYGLHKSLIGFDDANMRSVLAGKTINSVEIYLYSQHSYNTSGITYYLGHHNHDGKPTTFSQTASGMASSVFTARLQGKWVTVTDTFGQYLRDGSAKGFSIYTSSTAIANYGYCHGYGNTYPPQIRINYSGWY